MKGAHNIASRITTSAELKYPIPAPNTKVLNFVRLEESQIESPAAIRATARTMPSFNLPNNQTLSHPVPYSVSTIA